MYKLTKANVDKLVKNPLAVLKELSEDDIASILQQANQLYRNDKKTLFSDEIYDMIQDYLEEKNPNHPILKAVGAAVEDGKKETLPYYMGSLDKIKGDIKDLEKFTAKYPGDCVVSDKLDGNSGLLHVSKGVVKLYTRGDGTIGQNVSHVLPFIKGIPDLSKQKAELAVRGEVIISKAAFEKVKSKGANARNMVAGMLNAKLPDMEIAQSAEFVAYELIVPKLEPYEQMQHLEKLGFRVVYHKKFTELTNDKLSDMLVKRREESPYEIDGIVVIQNKVHNRISSGNPSYGFAFKSVHTMAKAEVIVQNVEWNLSKDGYLVPTIIFGSVALNGVTIQRATGFNGKFIKDNKIGPGSRIVIMRSGDVIPYVQEILTSSASGQPMMPEISYIWSDTGVNIMLSEEKKKDNDELKLKNFENFIKKVEIAGLGPGNIKKIYDAGIDTPKKLFAATQKDFLKVDGFKDKMATKIHDAVQERKNNMTCLQMMEASNMMGRGLGGKKLELILDAFPDILKKRYVPSLSEMVALKGVEKTTANLFISNLPKFFKFVDENGLKCNTVEPKKAPMTPANAGPNGAEAGPSGVAPSSPKPDFKGQKVVFTGFRNKDLEEYIKSRGGEVAGSVSGKTTLVVAKDVNEDHGKVNKAKELGVKLLSVEQFMKEYKIKL